MQIRFFFPELDHPAFGVVRAIAKDDTDTETGAAATVFLDSDNTVRPLLLLTCHLSSEVLLLVLNHCCIGSGQAS